MSSDSEYQKSDPEARVTEAVNGTLPASSPGTGTRLNGRYLIERELGRGGIGVVYLARDERLHSMPVVIKFLLETSGENAWLATKFLQEAEALTRINHPSVVKVIDRDTTPDGKPFFVMEFVSGRPLRSVMRAGGLSLTEVAPIIRQIGQGLAAAHQQGVIHRDLKPENILLQHLSAGEEQVKLIDFGIAKVNDSQSGAATEVSIIAGSLQYIAPEQVNAQPVSSATDVYAMSIVAYEMLTGKRPFTTTAAGYLAAVQQLALLQRNEQMVKPQHLRPELSAEADALIRSGLSFEASRRPQDAKVFGEQLARALAAPRETGNIASQPTTSEEATEVLSHSEKISQPGVPETVAKPRSSSGFAGVGIGAAVIVLGVLAVLTGIVPMPFGSKPTGEPPQAAAAAVTLNYSVTVQKDLKRYPGSKPFQLPGEVIFSAGDSISLNFISTQTGSLYIVNEEPGATAAGSTFNVLFPAAARSAGSTIVGGESIRLPEGGRGFVFDEHEGIEKLWIVFSPEPIPLFEGLKRWANPDDAGRIKDDREVGQLRAFLTDHEASPPEIEKHEETRETSLRAKTAPMVKLIKLEHH